MLSQIWEIIDRHTTKRPVMQAVASVWSSGSTEYRRIELAYDLSYEGHGRDTRHSGERYFRHILAVVVILLLYLKVHDADVIIAAFLHDLPEDKPETWSIERIEQEFGSRPARLVDAVTKPPKTRYAGNPARRLRVTFNKVRRGGRLAILLKLADRLHNMLTLWGTPKKKHAKIEETVRYVLPLAVLVGVLYQELILAIAAQIVTQTIDNNQDSEVGH